MVGTGISGARGKFEGYEKQLINAVIVGGSAVKFMHCHKGSSGN